MGVVCSDRCSMGQVVDWHGGPWVFLGYFLAWWDVFLGIFDVDRFIRGQIGVFLGVSGRFSGYFRCIMGFFGYFLG